MPNPQARRYRVTDFHRGEHFKRQWSLVLMLRRAAYTIDELAVGLNCTTRTVRRDLEVLDAAGLPIRKARRDDGRVRWVAGEMPEWPRRDIYPRTELAVRSEHAESHDC
jgi:hypothetical protein